MRLLSILCIFGLSAPLVHAYPEYSSFEQTQFSEDFGTFRWWRSCWWRVFDPNIYLQCLPDGQVYLHRITRPVSPRLSPAPGDGFRLSDVYGGTFTRFDGSGGFGSSLTTGVFSFDSFGNRITGSSNGFGSGSNGGDSSGNGFSFGSRNGDSDGSGATWRFSRDGTDSGRFSGSDRSAATWRFGGDGSGGRFAGTRMDDIFYRPLGFGCDDIDDFVDGGMFGPVPCTSYSNVFGPVPRY